MSTDIIWSIEKIKEGFERFLLENHRLPTTPEIDSVDYLPSSKQLQRRFGGVKELRKLLGYQDVDFGAGKYRRDISLRTNKRGREAELELEKILRNKFGEVFVHTERIFDDSKNRVDFYIYTPSGNFGIDIFYTDTIRDLQKNINLKIDKYNNFKEPLYFVVANDNFTQTALDNYSANKKKFISTSTRIINLNSLYKIINDMKIYANPVK